MNDDDREALAESDLPENPSRDDEEPANTGGRTAHVSWDAADDPIGAALFFTAEELTTLGVDPEITDTVNVSVENGEVSLSAGDETEGSR